MKARPRIVVLGGGFAGLESAFCLAHRLTSSVDVTLVSDRDHFLFKPDATRILFGEDPGAFVVPLQEPTARKGMRFVIDGVRGIDPRERRVLLEDGELVFDHLVIATGAGMRPEEIPGLKEHGHPVWGPAEMLRLREGLQAIEARAKRGARQDLLFLVCPDNRCAGPLYELCLMTDTWLRREGVRGRVRITWATCEESYLQAFGPRLDTAVKGEFEDRHIEGFNGWVVTEVEAGVVHFRHGDRLRYDLLVSFPPCVARVAYPSLPIDDRGFIQVEPDSRRVNGREGIFAAGDAADFPIKQAFLALLQGDAAADHIAAEIAGEPARMKFESMSLSVMDEINRSAAAPEPLHVPRDRGKRIRDERGGAAHYKVGISPLWRVGKGLPGLYLPWRFESGEPFHAGFAPDTTAPGR